MAASERQRLVLLLTLLLVAAALPRASTRSHPAAPAGFVLPQSAPSSSGQQQPRPSSPAASMATSKPLPLSRRGRGRTGNQRHALPPFDTPLDPATIEAMVQQAAAASGGGAVGGLEGLGPVGEVTTEQLWAGFVAGVFPFVWAGYEFWKRIDTQQRCGVCLGSGLVYESRSGRKLEVPRKCYACGGFLPWMGWRRFWLSNLDIGNGGILQRPAPDYEALSAEAKAKRRQEEAGDE